MVRSIRERISTFEVQQVLTLIATLEASAKDELVSVPLQDFPQKQAEARTYRQLLDMLLDERPSISAPQE